MKNWTRAPHGTNRGGGEATPNRERNQQEPNKEPRKAGPFRNQGGTQEKQRNPRDAQTEASNRRTAATIGRRPKGNAKTQRGQ